MSHDHAEQALIRHMLADAQHPDVRHACPECVVGFPNVFCPVCLGAGTVTTDRLDRYMAQIHREAR